MSEAKTTENVIDSKEKSAVISVRNVTKKYILGAQEIMALNDVSLDIDEQDFITIQGPSGCGKSTLLNMIGVMDVPTEGNVFIRGKKISDLSEDERAEIRANHIGFVFQFYNLIEHLSAMENVAIAVAAKGIKDDKERKKRAVEVLEKIGLGRRLNNKPEELSGGERQRVAIARAIVNNPSVIIADEPTGDLDTETGAEILRLLTELNEKEKRTILIVSHDPSIGSMGKRRIRMKDYEIISDER